MKVYSITETIDALPNVIWDVLTDPSKYHQWNPSLHKAEGQVKSGGRLKLYMKAQPERAIGIKVTAFDPDEYMVWVGGMPFGLFKGVRTFTLTHLVDDTTKFEMEEVFSGLMSGFILRSMPDMNVLFQQFTQGLKRQAESITNAKRKSEYIDDRENEY